MDIIRDNLIKLSNICAPSGRELKGTELIIRMLQNYTENIKTDTSGNILACIGGQKNGLKVMLEAHYDEISLTVESIDDKGFIKFLSVLGNDLRTLLTSEVIIHGKREIYGIISSTPPHLQKKEDSEKPISCEDLIIDTGLKPETLREFVKPGDLITYRPFVTQLKNYYISGKAFDNRAGVAAILTCLEMLKRDKLPVELWISFTVQEEAGTKGAASAAYSINPDIAIIFDVSFAKTHDLKEDKTGACGKGPMIGIAPVLDRGVFKRLCKIAENDDIPHQIEVMPGSTGTNAWAVQTIRAGIRTGLISIPLRYMHTQVETLFIPDIENSAGLCAEFIRSLRGGIKFD